MPRVQLKTLSLQKREENLNFLWSSISTLSSAEEVENFLKELLTDSEALMLSRRLQIASLLLKNNTCDGISERLGVGKNTVTTVNGWLKNINPEKQKLIQELEKGVKKKKHLKNEKQSYSDPFSLSHLKKKYPLYFLLFNLMDEADRKIKQKTDRQKKS